MLVLTRRLMEKLFIGDDICVTVVRLEGGQVRLGIEAPRDISVVRAELVPERLAHHIKSALASSRVRRDLRIPPAVAQGSDGRRRRRSR
jgi:carbon storage regulator